MAAMIAAGAAAACSPSSPRPGEIALATSRPGIFDNGCPAALIEGTLVADPGSGTAIQNGSGTIGVIWPSGFAARLASGSIEVLDGAGAVVARTGEHVALSGGMITADQRWSTCGPPLKRG
jgi:hypothetical protein